MWDITPILALKIWQQIAPQISTNAQCQSSERRIAPLHSVTEYQHREVMDSSKARQKVECHTKTNIQFSPMLRNMPVKEEHCKKVTSRATNCFEYNEFQMSSRFDRHAE